ncbi:hypothetical protein L6452_01087 [Arctium lappa]|uniref:Uncharacterized protein n=1 Tax=Arctium lappa TaxID=4217 RepID=A0ACB9FGI8_ARCLA|nr:hypothetical protein L6452_01087 [Arctium lappa]
MAIDIGTLKARYIDSCSDWSILPNKAVLSAFFKAELNKSNNEESSFVIFLDDLKGVDFHPLYNVFAQIDISEINSVDILQKSSCSLEGDSVLLLLRAVNQKLRVVDLQDRIFGKDFLLYVLHILTEVIGFCYFPFILHACPFLQIVLLLASPVMPSLTLA